MPTNPLRDNLRIEATPGPTTLVIFGASGDLTRRKLLPAVYHLALNRRLPARFAVLGVGRTELDDDGFRAQFEDSLREFAKVEQGDEVAASIAQRMFYLAGELSDADLYQRVKARLAEIDGADGVLHYLAVPPSVYEMVITHLGEAGLASAEAPAWRRVIIEKPFGTDLASARKLNAVVHQHFDEEQVFRIDHYLGKETVQNLMVFRFGNGMFEPIWNRRYIDHVQITAAETVGVERRAAYYEGAGALRDMVQNHMMQLLALVAMEPPAAFTAESVRDRKMDALAAVQPLVDAGDGSKTLASVVRAQYRDGWVSGAPVPGYRQEPDVDPGSTTESFVALRVQLDSWRWAGVPFYIRTGKRLPKRTTEIAIQFRRPPLQIFKRVSPSSVAPNLLIVNVQPDEGISVRFEAKLPGTRMQLAPVMMNFRYGTAFGGVVPEAYETLLLDAMLGDPTLFARHDFVELSWALITPVHEAWQHEAAAAIPEYEAGVGPGGSGRAPRSGQETMEDAVSESVMESGTSVAFGEIEAALAREGARPRDGAAPTRALTATVVAVGPRARLEEAVGPLQAPGTSGAIRGILIPQGPASVSRAQVASNVVVLNGLTDNFIDNAVAALRLSSLPTVIWWRGGPTDVLDNLITLADRVVLDAEPPDAGWACALGRLDRAAFSDLRWTRLTRWRALMAQFFDMPEVRAAAPSFTRLRVEGSDRPAAALFAAWMKDALRWGPEVTIDIVESPCRLALGRVALSGGGLDLNLHLDDSRSCVTSAATLDGQAGISRVVSLGDESLTSLLSEELRVRSRDHAFERALRAMVAS